jgi:hypothetical protein
MDKQPVYTPNPKPQILLDKQLFQIPGDLNFLHRPLCQHLGRFLAGMTAVVGIVTASLLAAALRNALEWTNEESVVGNLLEREKNRMWMRVQATRVIQSWWFDIKKRRLAFLVKSRLRFALSPKP